MNVWEKIKRLAGNDLSHLIGGVPLSFIVGEHPSEYAVSPTMWNKEFDLRNIKHIFFAIDIPLDRAGNLEKLLDVALDNPEHFRVLTITNPYKVKALEYFRKQAESFPNLVKISVDAERIGATNQILVGPDGIFNVINSDGAGMGNAVETYLAELELGDIKDKKIAVIGAGGAARGIVYELAKRVSAGKGSVSIFNRTVENAGALSREFGPFFPKEIAAHSLGKLHTLAANNDVLVSVITEGDPLFDNTVYETFGYKGKKILIVDANYGEKSVLARNARRQAPQACCEILDGSGMVVEGYIIPSGLLAKLWKYDVPFEIYQAVGEMFNYSPRKS